jgi:hypothetical protein
MTPSAPRPPVSVTLVLTATVDPRPVPKLVQTQPAARAAEYATALRRWTRESSLFKKIIWWENSNHPLAHKIAAEFAPTVSAHVFRAEPFESRLGKGYGEALMLEQIAHVGIGSTYALKCTGRLSVVNIRSLLSILHSAPDIVIRLSQDLTYADSRLFVVSSKLLPELTADLEGEVNDDRGAYLEHALARRVLRLASEGAKIRFWATPPRFRGRSGSTGRSYDSLPARLGWPAEAVFYRIKRLGTFL